MKDPLTHPLFVKLMSLDLPSNDYAVFGSGSMWLHGLKDLGNDIDLIARGKAWEKAVNMGTVIPAPTKGNVVKFENGEIEVYDTWAPGEWDTDELINTAIMISGIKFVSLENVRKWKLVYGREKDLAHVKLIQDYLGTPHLV